MNTAPQYFSSPLPPPKRGLAIASLVLGILGFFLSFFLVGALLAVVGLALGLVYILRKRGPNGMAWWGVSLSVVSILIAIGMGFAYFALFKSVKETISSMQSGTGPETQWEGVLAPDFAVTNLDGKAIQMKELRGKRVVLDFWATWCPPCVKEIPEFIKLRNETSSDELVIVGISEESPEVLKAFVKKNGINYPIVSAANLPAPFKNLEAVPTTFFIDRKGVIQSVAVGSRSYADLKQLALAKDFEGESKAQPPAAPASGLKDADKMLQPVSLWSTNLPGAAAICSGDWDGGGISEILVADGQKLHVLDLNGNETKAVSLPERFSVIECSRHGPKGARLLGYSQWGQHVEVIDSNGKKLWSYSSLMGVDGAHWGDLDGDGTDEMIVGMNGFGGLQALSADGNKLWHASLGNVWSQAIVSATHERPATVLASEAGGTVRLYDGQGKGVRTLRPAGAYCTKLAAGSVDSSGKVQVLALGQNQALSSSQALAFDSNGQVAWSAPAQAVGGGVNARFACGDVAGNGSLDWVFIVPSGDLVVATATGEKLAALPAQSGVKDFILVPDSTGRAFLVTLQGPLLQAYSFK